MFGPRKTEPPPGVKMRKLAKSLPASEFDRLSTVLCEIQQLGGELRRPMRIERSSIDLEKELGAIPVGEQGKRLVARTIRRSC